MRISNCSTRADVVADYINQDVPWEPALWSWPPLSGMS
jgi:hypothetical protein